MSTLNAFLVCLGIYGVMFFLKLVTNWIGVMKGVVKNPDAVFRDAIFWPLTMWDVRD